ncbi:5'/3'-nucleotidase SurE [Streptomyces sp. NPDC048172]|uniref:5'/3'-nucleotidase SurE n=1 Tax=Streptomyces sp. NPDC048172 TaxID=3365505 RepID=UPI003710554B
MRIRRTVVLLAVAGSAAGLVAGSGVAGARPAERAAAERERDGLRILVSNDDGYRHPYLHRLRDALAAAGHTAVIVAPAEDQSGRGTGLNFTSGATVRAVEAEPGVWSVTGSPGDAVAFGAERVLKDPDLVVSGVNAGPNSGTSANHSGTVGATVMAQDLGVPSLAVSAGYDLSNPQDPFPSASEAADFTVRTVERLARTAARGAPLLPPHSSLNVNYPAKPDGGLAFTNVGHAREITRSFTPDPGECAECYKVRLGVAPDAPEPVPNADTSALRRGDVSVSLLTGDWSAPAWAEGQPPPSSSEVRRTKARLLGLRP